MKQRFAIFDLDGTLLDTMQYWRTSVRIFAEINGLPPEEELYEKFESLPSQAALERIRRESKVDRIRNMTYADVLATIEYCYRYKAKPRKGVIDLLQALKAAGVRMCVISATPTKQVTVGLQTAGIDGYFEFILSPDDFPECKTSPRILREAARRFGCRPEEMMIFEDSYYSMQTAKALGIYIIAVEEKYSLEHKDDILNICDEYHCDFTDVVI